MQNMANISFAKEKIKEMVPMITEHRQTQWEQEYNMFFTKLF